MILARLVSIFIVTFMLSSIVSVVHNTHPRVTYEVMR